MRPIPAPCMRLSQDRTSAGNIWKRERLYVIKNKFGDENVHKIYKLEVDIFLKITYSIR